MEHLFIHTKNADGTMHYMVNLAKVEVAQRDTDTSYSLFISGFQHRYNYTNKESCDNNWTFICNELDKLYEIENNGTHL